MCLICLIRGHIYILLDLSIFATGFQPSYHSKNGLRGFTTKFI